MNQGTTARASAPIGHPAAQDAAPNLSLLSQETVEIQRRKPPLVRRVPAHRYGDFAVHRNESMDLFKQDWAITHLPTGRLLADNFRTFERAAAAMIDVARIRNDWAIVGDEECTDELRDRCREIVGRYGGYVGHRQDSLPRRPAFNGYQSEHSPDQ